MDNFSAVCDLTEPDESYLHSIAFNVYYQETWSYLDGRISSIKAVEDMVTEGITDLGVWVCLDEVEEANEGQRFVRLDYEASSDVSTVEYLTGSSYTVYHSHETEEGKAAVDFEYYSLSNSNMRVSYVEGDYWEAFFGQLTYDDAFGSYSYRNPYLIHADLSKDPMEVCQIRGAEHESEMVPSFETRKDGVVLIQEKPNGNDSASYGYHLYDRQGYNVMRYSSYGVAEISLYQLEGWDSIIAHCLPGEVLNTDFSILELKIGENAYLDYRGADGLEAAGVSFGFGTIPSGVTVEPTLSFLCEKEKLAETTETLLQALGLRFKGDYAETLFSLIHGAEEALASTTAFGKQGFNTITMAQMQNMFDYLSLPTLGQETFLTMRAQDKILKSQQSGEDFKKETSFSVTKGLVAIDKEQNALDFSGLELTAKASALESGESYYASLGYQKGEEFVHCLDSEVQASDGENDLAFAFPNGSFDCSSLSTLINDFSYRLVGRLFHQGEESDAKVLSDAALSCGEDSLLMEREEDYTTPANEPNMVTILTVHGYFTVSGDAQGINLFLRTSKSQRTTFAPASNS